jgi:hypothetical protein
MRNQERDKAQKQKTRDVEEAHHTTESNTDPTQVQGPHGEVKPLRPALLYCTAIPREVYMVLVTEL